MLALILCTFLGEEGLWMTKNKKWIVLFLLPGILLFGFVFLGSMVMLVTTSFTDWAIGKDMSFVGLKNYIYLFTEDETFIESVKNTIIWILLQSTFHVLIGTTVALILAKKRWYSNAVRTIFFIPNIISSAALGMLFLCVMNPQYGLVNTFITKLTGEGFYQNWFMDPKTAFLSVTLTWLPYAGLVTILVMAEMSSTESRALSRKRFSISSIPSSFALSLLSIFLPP